MPLVTVKVTHKWLLAPSGYVHKDLEYKKPRTAPKSATYDHSKWLTNDSARKPELLLPLYYTPVSALSSLFSTRNRKQPIKLQEKQEKNIKSHLSFVIPTPTSSRPNTGVVNENVSEHLPDIQKTDEQPEEVYPVESVNLVIPIETFVHEYNQALLILSDGVGSRVGTADVDNVNQHKGQSKITPAMFKRAIKFRIQCEAEINLILLSLKYHLGLTITSVDKDKLNSFTKNYLIHMASSNSHTLLFDKNPAQKPTSSISNLNKARQALISLSRIFDDRIRRTVLELLLQSLDKSELECSEVDSLQALLKETITILEDEFTYHIESLLEANDTKTDSGAISLGNAPSLLAEGWLNALKIIFLVVLRLTFHYEIKNFQVLEKTDHDLQRRLLTVLGKMPKYLTSHPYEIYVIYTTIESIKFILSDQNESVGELASTLPLKILSNVLKLKYPNLETVETVCCVLEELYHKELWFSGKKFLWHLATAATFEEKSVRVFLTVMHKSKFLKSGKSNFYWEWLFQMIVSLGSIILETEFSSIRKLALYGLPNTAIGGLLSYLEYDDEMHSESWRIRIAAVYALSDIYKRVGSQDGNFAIYSGDTALVDTCTVLEMTAYLALLNRTTPNGEKDPRVLSAILAHPSQELGTTTWHHHRSYSRSSNYRNNKPTEAIAKDKDNMLFLPKTPFMLSSYLGLITSLFNLPFLISKELVSRFILSDHKLLHIKSFLENPTAPMRFLTQKEIRQILLKDQKRATQELDRDAAKFLAKYRHVILPKLSIEPYHFNIFKDNLKYEDDYSTESDAEKTQHQLYVKQKLQAKASNLGSIRYDTGGPAPGMGQQYLVLKGGMTRQKRQHVSTALGEMDIRKYSYRETRDGNIYEYTREKSEPTLSIKKHKPSITFALRTGGTHTANRRKLYDARRMTILEQAKKIEQAVQEGVDNAVVDKTLDIARKTSIVEEWIKARERKNEEIVKAMIQAVDEGVVEISEGLEQPFELQINTSSEVNNEEM